MTIELIEVVPLKRDFTQVPNELILSDVGNNTFRVLVWLLSLRGGAISSRQIATAGKIAYDGRPHRAVMKELRKRGILQSRKVFADGQVAGEVLKIDPNVIVENVADGKSERVSGSPARAKRPNRRAKRPTASCVSSEPLKTNCAGERPPTKGEAIASAETRPNASEDLAKKAATAKALGLPYRDVKTGEWVQPKR